MEILLPNEAAKIEPILPELFAISNEYWVSFWVNDVLYDKQFLTMINRPIRVCGMVKYEGYPGGGPFMVEKNGIVTKQIIEKAQVIDNADENILFSSTHFNPVMMVVCKKDLNDMDIPLSEFVDDNAFLKISKSVQNEEISFLELPGLWNGSMYFWNSVFVEIPNETFSPVKSALDLLSPLHMK